MRRNPTELQRKCGVRDSNGCMWEHVQGVDVELDKKGVSVSAGRYGRMGMGKQGDMGVWEKEPKRDRRRQGGRGDEVKGRK